MKTPLVVIVIGLAMSFSAGNAPAQKEVRDENLDSLSRAFQATTRALTTPEFERRKKVLRLFQQRGYVQVLTDVTADDGVSALLSLLKVNAQIAYHLPHNVLVFYIPPAGRPRPAKPSPWQFYGAQSQPYTIPLIQDWTFPADPWSDK
jgi:hypothetical protein